MPLPRVPRSMINVVGLELRVDRIVAAGVSLKYPRRDWLPQPVHTRQPLATEYAKPEVSMRAASASSHRQMRGGASSCDHRRGDPRSPSRRLFAGFLAEDVSDRDKVSLEALTQAKAGLIAYAVSVQPDTYAKRPGELPCPDLDNDGDAEITCFQAEQRIGRLPWRTLKLPDLRDGSGERLWYALSTTFQRKTFNQCPTSGGPACLNSDTRGTLTVRDSAGVVIFDASGGGGAIAVLLAPGPVITRIGKREPQDRSCAGDANARKCEQSGVCTGPSSARCQAINYLDVAGPPALSVRDAHDSTEDNADFSDSRDNGLIAGPVRDSSGPRW